MTTVYHDGQEMYNRLLEIAPGVPGRFIDACALNVYQINDVRRTQSGTVLLIDGMYIKYHHHYGTIMFVRLIFNRYGFFFASTDTGQKVVFHDTTTKEFFLGLGEAKRKLDGLLTCFDHIR